MISTYRFCIKEIVGNRFKSSVGREARMLQKLINKGLTEKKPQSQGNKIISKQFLFSSYDNEHYSPRLTALSKTYMEHINELLNNGKYGRQLLNLEVEVTKVNFSKCAKYLNVYFISKNASTPPQTLKETLIGALAELQAGVGENRYLARVPNLRFVRDKMLENAIQLDKVFNDLDFGRDYTPVHDKKVITEHSPIDDGEPIMRQDLFGVDVATIKKKISSNLRRFKAINIETPESETWPEYETTQNLIHFNKKDFIKFFKRRRIAELKRQKQEHREMAAMKSKENYNDGDDEEETEYDFEDYDYFLKDEYDEDVKDEKVR